MLRLEAGLVSCIHLLIAVIVASCPGVCPAADRLSTESQVLIEAAESLFKAGRYDSLVAMGERALRIAEAEPPAEDSTVVKILLNLGKYYHITANYIDAEATWTRSLQMAETIHGPVHPDVVKSLNRLAILWWSKGDYPQAERYFLRAIDISEQLFGPNHSEVAKSLHNLALVFWNQGKHTEARDRTRRAHIIWAKTLGAEHPNVASSLHLQGVLSYELGEYEKAEQAYNRALAIRELALGPEHPEVASTLLGLANLQFDLGLFERALPNFRRVQAIWTTRFGPKHPRIASILISQAIFYRVRGDLQQSEKMLLEALEITRESVGSSHDVMARALNSLGNIYLEQNKLPEAEDVFRQARAIFEQTLGPEHIMLARNLNNLGIVCHRQAKLEEARQLVERSVELLRKTYWAEESHPFILDCFHTLAGIHRSLGNIDEAELLYLRVLAADKASSIGAQMTAMLTMMQLAHLYVVKGDTAAALEYYKSFFRRRREFLQSAFSSSSEAQKFHWLRKYPLIDGSLLTLALNDPGERSKRPALEVVLNGKAVVTDAVMAEQVGALGSCEEPIREMLADRADICTLIANMVMAEVVTTSAYEYRDRLTNLHAKKDTIEAELSRMCADFVEGSASPHVTIEDIAAALPKGALLCEYLIYEPFNFDLPTHDADQTGEPRYVLFLLDAAGIRDMVDIGPAHLIDSLVRAARKALYTAAADVYSPSAARAEQKLNRITRRLFDKLFAPITRLDARPTRLLVAPDGLLNLLPFEILPLSDDRYVIEDYRISYLSCGRDLVRDKRELTRSNKVLLLADPDFEYLYKPPGDNLTNINSSQDSEASIEQGYQTRSYEACAGMLFSAMRASREEVAKISSIIAANTSLSVQVVTGAEASERLLKDLDFAPRVLHLATHGFFCDKGADTETAPVNPLLRSGLALAGANRRVSHADRRGPDPEDGILTALEVSAMNLYGTELAVLSACESGVGEVVEGEGIFGLRRALQHAGCESIILSLWQVPDRAAVKLTTGYYERWLTGQSKIDALRASSLELLELSRNEHGHGHPLVWGGFVLTGETE